MNDENQPPGAEPADRQVSPIPNEEAVTSWDEDTDVTAELEPLSPSEREEVAEVTAGNDLAEEESWPRFDPVAAFLSAQSTFEQPRERDEIAGRVSEFASAAAVISAPEPYLQAQTDWGNSACPAEAETEHEEPEPAADADGHYRKHWFMRLFAAACWLVVILFIGAVGAGFIYYRYAQARLFQKQTGAARTIDFAVQPGDSYRRVVGRLDEAGLLGSYMGIDDSYLMRYLAWTEGNASKIRHGAYRIDSTASLSDVYHLLLKGSKQFRLTIPEGHSVRQIADLAAKRFESFDPDRFVDLTRDQEFITSLNMFVPSLEGYLLPGTYDFGPGMKEEELIRQLVGAFRKAAESRLKEIPKRDELSFHEHVIMASLIEREARMDEDRPLIASVIFNRLKKEMKLQIDATVNYALNDWRALTHEDYKVESPFNTYKIKGLPPDPICNPRIESLIATYTAPETDYLFYVHRGDGTHAFTQSYEDHLKNVKKYIGKGSKDTAEAGGDKELIREQ